MNALKMAHVIAWTQGPMLLVSGEIDLVCYCKRCGIEVTGRWTPELDLTIEAAMLAIVNELNESTCIPGPLE